MCGIVGVLAAGSKRPSVHDAQLIAMRDAMSHRGPDDAGLWKLGSVALAHRRLSVLDPSRAGHQPMLSPDAKSALVYNGELYNDHELRDALGKLGVTFKSTCDTETLLATLLRNPAEAPALIRGMYAFAFIDTHRKTALLARDPLGIKPLYYAFVESTGPDGPTHELAFASEIPALLRHPAIRAKPDLVGVSGYLTTIRTTLGPRTLFEGIRTLRPGEWLTVDFSGPRLEHRSDDWWSAPRRDAPPAGAAQLQQQVRDSVRRHLRSDVPICTLLSGGLDSTIITTTARELEPTLDLCTYCAGADEPEGDDLPAARRIAASLATRHTEARITRDHFAKRWPEMVRATGLPIGTPNEIAINEVARRLRADGKIVALSGEGADELFAGYDAPLDGAAEAIAKSHPGEWLADGGITQLDLAAWIPSGAKPQVLAEQTWIRLESDSVLRDYYRDEFVRVATLAGVEDPLAAHQCFIRRINLAGLLLRLDQSTMLESVEGRTPLADQSLASFAESLPMSAKYSAGATPKTKRILREAFQGKIDAEALTRPKASFPLPFQEWAADNSHALNRSPLARELFNPLAISTVLANPRQMWRLAWPMINIALWGERWWP